MKKILCLAVALLFTACTPPQQKENTENPHASHGGGDMTESKDRLNDSPRHHEWVEVQNGDKIIHTWVVYPERSDDAPVVLVIHENRGLNDWARSLADQVAEAGYIAVAPDLLSGFSEEFDRTSDFADDDAARDALYQLDAAQVLSDLEAVATYAKSIEASNGKLATAGFCWGGAKSFEFASASSQPDVAMVFYGTSPEDTSAYDSISVPVIGFYGGADERVNATIDRAVQAMEGKTYEVEIYEGAGHAYMRSGEDPSGDPANITAREKSWERMKEVLKGLEGAPEEVSLTTIEVKVLSVENQKDGKTAGLETKDGQVYQAVFSIPNMGAESEFDLNDLEEGRILTVTGEVWEMEGVQRLTVRKAETMEVVE